MRKVSGKSLENQEKWIGNEYGNLTVTRYVGHNKNKHAVFEFKCECGSFIEYPIIDVRSGSPSCCGCNRNRYKCKNRNLYLVWYQMIKRCSDKSSKDFKYYGARGISVCKAWLDFDVFANWAISKGYKKGLTIERNNVDGDYCPQNCSWETWEIQAKNKRNRS